MQRLSWLPHSRKGGDLLWYLKQIKCYIYWFSKVSSDLLQVNGDQELGKKKKKGFISGQIYSTTSKNSNENAVNQQTKVTISPPDLILRSLHGCGSTRAQLTQKSPHRAAKGKRDKTTILLLSSLFRELWSKQAIQRVFTTLNDSSPSGMR